jgi:hypothetical protein
MRRATVKAPLLEVLRRGRLHYPGLILVLNPDKSWYPSEGTHTLVIGKNGKEEER